MAYCSKCGKKNDDDAEFCSKCGTELKGAIKDRRRERDDCCEEECIAGKNSSAAPVFWGIIVIIIGLWILFEFVIKNTTLVERLPQWLVEFEFWWIVGLLIAVAVIVTGIRMIVRK